MVRRSWSETERLGDRETEMKKGKLEMRELEKLGRERHVEMEG